MSGNAVQPRKPPPTNAAILIQPANYHQSIHAKHNSDDDGKTLVNEGTKSLADENEARQEVSSRALIEHNNSYVSSTNPQR